MRTNMKVWVAAAWACLSSAACGNAGSDRVLAVEAVGTVAGSVFFDANGSRSQDVGDAALAGVRVQLVAGRTGEVVKSETTGPDGVYLMEGVPVGDYDVTVDPRTIGDTVVVAVVTPRSIRVSPDDSVGVTVGVAYPRVTVTEARAATFGRRVFLEGVALNAAVAFGDTTVHVADITGAIRATRVRQSPQAVGVGDSVRFLGTVRSRAGQPTLDDVTPFPVAFGQLPTAVEVTSAVAALADGGRLDAALIRVVDATILDTTAVVGGFRLDADDGSGLLEIVLSAPVGFALTPLVPGAIVEVTGVLVPTGTGTWRLKPRLTTDVIVK